MKALPIAAVAAAVALAAAVYVLGASPSAEGGEGLLVVVTVPGLEEDVGRVLCPDDRVEVLMPAGADPHEYQLRPSDAKLLERADLVVSTGHTGFEAGIERLAEQGVLRALVISAVRVARVVLVNPATGSPNLHAVYYDPRNLAALLEAVADTASSLRPGCSAVYREAVTELAREIDALLDRYAGAFNATAVGDLPAVQYAVEWLGVRVVALAAPEHGLQASPELVERIEELLSSGAVDLVVVVEGSPAQATGLLLELARRYGVPVVEVPAPSAPGSMVAKARLVAERVEAALEGGGVGDRG